MSTKKNDDDEIYVYVGDGLGIPGLPHRLSRTEAEKQQVLKAFDDAIDAGVYVLESATEPKQDKE